MRKVKVQLDDSHEMRKRKLTSVKLQEVCNCESLFQFVTFTN